MLENFAMCAPPDRVGAALAERYGDLCHRITLGAIPVSAAHWASTISALGSVAPAPRPNLTAAG